MRYRSDFDNCERIYPIQQRKIRAILDRVEGIAAVKKIFVFESSVTPACHIGSDVDIYFELDGERTISLSDFDFEGGLQKTGASLPRTR